MKTRIPNKWHSIFMMIFIAGTVTANGQRVTTGTRVKIESGFLEKGQVSGTLIGVNEAHYSIQNSGSIFLVPAEEIDQFYVSNGSRGHAKLGIAIGLVIGGITGAVIGSNKSRSKYRTCKPEDMWDCFFYPSKKTASTFGAIIGGVIGGSAGSFAGGIIGVSIRTEKWKKVQPEINIGPAPIVTSGRLYPGAGIKISF